MKSFLCTIILFAIVVSSCKKSSIDNVVVPIPEDLETKMTILDTINIGCESYWIIAQEKPAFLGCENHIEEEARIDCTREALTDFIIKNLKLSRAQYKEEFSNKCETTNCPLTVEFLVDTEGRVHRPTIYAELLEQASDFLKDRLLQVISCLPNFTPAVHRDEIVCIRFRYTIVEGDFKD